jgi:hypothetical protein
MTFAQRDELSTLTGLDRGYFGDLYRSRGDDTCGAPFDGSVFWWTLGSESVRFAPAEKLTNPVLFSKTIHSPAIPDAVRWKEVIEPIMADAKVV